MAIRPKTLGAAIAPVLMGVALAWGGGVFYLPAALFCGLGALLIQIGTNLANDYFDFLKGADNEKRLGPVRVTQAGLVTPATMKWAFISVFGLAVLAGLPLMLRGGWPIVVIGVLSVASGVLYTSGPYALAYTGLADLFVLIFFGPVAVGGTYYLQTLTISPLILMMGFAPGLIATGLLTVNNLRDIDNDREAHKKTLAVRFGVTFARLEYVLCLFLACALPVVAYLHTGKHPYAIGASLILFLAIPTVKVVFTSREGAVLNRALARTGQLLLLFSIFFSIGWIL